LLAKRKILNTNPRLLRPLPVGMQRNEVAIGVHSVCATGVLPIAVFPELCDARARLGRQLALRVPLNELAVPLDAVGRFRRAPILLFATASSEQHQ
jgi:hypothetical protein